MPSLLRRRWWPPDPRRARGKMILSNGQVGTTELTSGPSTSTVKISLIQYPPLRKISTKDPPFSPPLSLSISTSLGFSMLSLFPPDILTYATGSAARGAPCGEEIDERRGGRSSPFRRSPNYYSLS